VDDLGYNNVPWRNPEQAGAHPADADLSDLVLTEGVRLQRLYAYAYCSPTRSSLMSGRFPYHVSQQNPTSFLDTETGVDLRMSWLPQKLQAAGYYTAMLGKHHMGARSAAVGPRQRGFDFFLGIHGNKADHRDYTRDGYTDLWVNDGPAFGVPAPRTYSSHLYTEEALKIIDAHNPAVPLFMFMSHQTVGRPYFAPAEYEDAAVAAERRAVTAMVSTVSEATMNLTDALKAKGMWANSFMMWLSDNGGPHADSRGHNNWPLRGGKGTFYEGGMRVAAFAAGGAMAPSLKGGRIIHPLHVADVFPTFCRMAGLSEVVCRDDPTDTSVPSVDGVSLADTFLADAAVPARPTEIVLGARFRQRAILDSDGEHKYVRVSADIQGFWTGPEWPEDGGGGKIAETAAQKCDSGCLFNVRTDPEELVDLSGTPAGLARFNALRDRLAILSQGTFQTDSSNGYDTCETLSEFAGNNQGFIGPLCVLGD
jgi:arylsulfatase B